MFIYFAFRLNLVTTKVKVEFRLLHTKKAHATADAQRHPFVPSALDGGE